MEQLLGLVARLEGDVHTDALEELLVHPREDDTGVGLAAPELVQLVDGVARHGVGRLI